MILPQTITSISTLRSLDTSLYRRQTSMSVIMAENQTLFGHKRPLDPPESRLVVMAQAKAAENWVYLDAMDDLFISVPRKQIKLRHTTESFGISEAMLKKQTSPAEAYGFTLSAGTQNTNPSRRLFISSNLSEKPNQDVASSGTQDRPIESLDRSIESRTADGTHGSSRNYVENEIRPVDDGLEEALRLARITSGGLSPSPNSCSAESASPGPTQSDIIRERLELEGQERSRRLREKALARRALGSATRQERQQSETNEARVAPSDASVRPSTPALSGDLPLRTNRPLSPNIDELFGIAERAAQADESANEKPLDKTADIILAEDECRSHLRDRRNSSRGLHPASRQAAETYRTQDRHLTNNSSILKDWRNGNLEKREERLRQYTSGVGPSANGLGLQPQTSSDVTSTLQCANTLQHVSKSWSPQSTPTPRTGLLDEADKACDGASLTTLPGDSNLPAPATSEKEDNLVLSPVNHLQQSAWRFPPLKPATYRSDLVKTAAEPDESSVQDMPYTSPTISPLSLPSRLPLAHTTKELPIQTTGTTSANQASTSTAIDDAEDYPVQGTDLTLPKRFESLGKERQTIVKEHETLKEHERDLEAILSAFEQAARLGSLDQFTQRETTEITTLKRFTRAVVDEGLSGKRRRKRILDIAGNMKRRILRRSPPLDYPFENLLDKLLRPEIRAYIERTLAETRERAEELKIKRQQHSPRKKNVRFQPTSSTKSQNSHNTKRLNRLNLSSTEKRRLANYDAQDRGIAALRRINALFEDSQQTTDNDDSTPGRASNGNSHLRPEADDLESNISEEEDGAEYFSQSQNVELAEEMHRKNQQRAILHEHNVQQPNFEIVSAVNERAATEQSLEQEDPEDTVEFDDLDFDACDQTSNPNSTQLIDRPDSEERFCHRYTLKSTHLGMQDYDYSDADEYTHGHFTNFQTALARSHALRKEIEERYEFLSSQKGGEARYRDFHIAISDSRQHDTGEWMLKIGKDERMSCRAWIEKQEYSPSKAVYEHARVARACHAKPVYTVLWERTVTRIHGPRPETDNENPQVNTGEVDGEVKEVTCIPFDALRLFSTIAHANRHAKDVFMRWFMDHYPNRSGHEYIEREENEIEKTLESYGDQTTWSHDDCFHVPISEDDGSGGGGSGFIGQEFERDCFKVWVVMRPVSGPGN